jgi:hypothetical protein
MPDLTPEQEKRLRGLVSTAGYNHGESPLQRSHGIGAVDALQAALSELHQLREENERLSHCTGNAEVRMQEAQMKQLELAAERDRLRRALERIASKSDEPPTNQEPEAVARFARAALNEQEDTDA